MNESKTLKDVLKPPFRLDGIKIRDADGCHIANFFTFPIDTPFDGLTAKEFGKWVMQALNEKGERDFGEPEQWNLKITEENYQKWLKKKVEEPEEISKFVKTLANGKSSGMLTGPPIEPGMEVHNEKGII